MHVVHQPRESPSSAHPQSQTHEMSPKPGDRAGVGGIQQAQTQTGLGSITRCSLHQAGLKHDS